MRSLQVASFVFGIILTSASSLLYNYNFDFAIKTYAQNESSYLDIPGNMVNSKYLSITGHRYRQGKLGYDTITGTTVNNAAKNISFATVYAALYDKDNIIITIESGSVYVSLLKAGDSSQFAIDIFGVKDIDHYTLFPAGIPS